MHVEASSVTWIGAILLCASLGVWISTPFRFAGGGGLDAASIRPDVLLLQRSSGAAVNPSQAAAPLEIGSQFARPLSRACILFVPAGSEFISNEALAFVESWRTLFEEPLSEEDLAPAVAALGDARAIEDGVDMTPPSTGSEERIRQVVFPWLEKGRRQLQGIPLADPPDIPAADGNYTLEPPDGPPLITDLIVATSSKFPLDIRKHPGCIGLSAGNSMVEALNMEELQTAVNLTDRVHAALEKLTEQSRATPNWTERTLQTRMREATLGESRCFYVRVSVGTEQPDAPFAGKHDAIHSVSALAAPAIASIAKHYDLLMRTDADCFLLPHFNDPRLVPWRVRHKEKQHGTGENQTNAAAARQGSAAWPFFVGQGGYNGPDQNRILQQYAEFVGLRHQGLRGVGSAWYGHSSDVLQTAALAVTAAEFLMNYDPLFQLPNGHGRWPQWYRGVVTLYGGELAVNHLIPAARLVYMGALMDGSSTSNSSVSIAPVVHVHCWHTELFYSKHAAYKSSLVLSPDADVTHPNWYAYLHSASGKRIGKRLVLSAPPPPPSSHLIGELIPVLESYMACPPEFPFMYNRGQRCCATNTDCEGNPLLHTSTCCDKHTPCVAGEVCYDRSRFESDPPTLLRPDVGSLQTRLRRRFSRFPFFEFPSAVPVS